jgi:fused signal recognition particle receptor
MGFFDKLKNGLLKTRENLSKQIDNVLKVFKKVDDELFEELFDALILADIGVAASEDIIERLKKLVKERHVTEADEVKALLKEIISDILGRETERLKLDSKPSVILVIGVNGVGKTTSIAKLANILKNDGKKVMLAAADTFRAAAIDQLGIWADRVGVEMIKHGEGADPAAVIFDGINAAKSRGADVLICDTAGRLHNKKNLMSELEKIQRVINRELPGGSREILLVLDATTGQNAVSQAREFKSVTDISGIILTKLDGTAKGGIVIAVKSELDIPVKLIGVGEKLDDMQIFNAGEFVDALFD